MSNEAITRLLKAASRGDAGAAARLIDMVYDDLRRHAGRLMSAERKNHTLQPTALVHEAYVNLVRQDRVDWQSRAHFFAVATQQMRRILVDHARKKKAARRGGDMPTLSLDEDLGLCIDNDTDLLALNDALEGLEAVHPRQAQGVVLRFFGGLTSAEIAAILGLSTRTIEGDWAVARAWLRREILS